MRRAERLIDLSREHHGALSLARRLRRVADTPASVEALAKTVTQAWAGLGGHFAREEMDLLSELERFGELGLGARLRAEHLELRRLARNPAAWATLVRFGMLLEAHVRFEERELFPALERHWSGAPKPAELIAEAATKPTRKIAVAAGLGRTASDPRPHLSTYFTP
ncbi:MAG: hemerythrin domain-containing protein [Rhodocyclaceae bacterium]|nr:hemerythrin domain-containing protein [Rhodocyclaceae bacterium]